MTRKKEPKPAQRASLQDKVIIAAVGFDDNAKAQQQLQVAFDKQAAEQGFADETKEEELKPCPFCGRTNTERAEAENSKDETLWYIECQWCGASSGAGYTKKEAGTLWNDRVEAPAPQWSTEPPTEVGDYWLYGNVFNNGNNEIVRTFVEPLGNSVVLEFSKPKSLALTEVCKWNVQWCKIVPPPMPKEGEPMIKTKEQELKPCPFCGRTNTYLPCCNKVEKFLL